MITAKTIIKRKIELMIEKVNIQLVLNAFFLENSIALKEEISTNIAKQIVIILN
jgi:hypothetical protein